MLKQVENPQPDKFKYHLFSNAQEGQCIKRSKTIIQLDMFLHRMWKDQTEVAKFDKFKSQYHVQVHPHA